MRVHLRTARGKAECPETFLHGVCKPAAHAADIPGLDAREQFIAALFKDRTRPRPVESVRPKVRHEAAYAHQALERIFCAEVKFLQLRMNLAATPIVLESIGNTIEADRTVDDGRVVEFEQSQTLRRGRQLGLCFQARNRFDSWSRCRSVRFAVTSHVANPASESAH